MGKIAISILLGRIVTLAPSITKEIYLLGLGDSLVGNTIYCTSPMDAKFKEKIGSILRLNVEKIVTLKPNIIIGTSLTPVKEVEKLRKLNLKVVVYPSAKNFTEICDNFIKLGMLLGKKSEAIQLVEKAKKEVEGIKSLLSKVEKVSVFVQIGTNPLFGVGNDSFIHHLIELAKGENIFKNIPSSIISREEVVKRNPEVIIITDMGVITEKEVEVWRKHVSIKAVKNNRIYTFSSHKLCSPTVVEFVEILKKIVKFLHPTVGE